MQKTTTHTPEYAPLSEDDREYLQSKIETEGFDYTFEGYSDFSDIANPYFHDLRERYLAARTELESYINGVSDETPQ